MTKTELIKAVAERTGFTQKDVRKVFDAQQEVTLKTLPSEEVKLMDGVTITTVERSERAARNPQTGESIIVPAHVAPKCKFGKAVKELFK